MCMRWWNLCLYLIINKHNLIRASSRRTVTTPLHSHKIHQASSVMPLELLLASSPISDPPNMRWVRHVSARACSIFPRLYLFCEYSAKPKSFKFVDWFSVFSVRKRNSMDGQWVGDIRVLFRPAHDLILVTDTNRCHAFAPVSFIG